MPKIRGLKRRGKSIEQWRRSSLHLDMPRLLDHGRTYVKLSWIGPWGNLFATEAPKAGHRAEMLSALLDVYENWRAQLDELSEPYYLKIWLFNPRFMRSQVVCAINDHLAFYDNAFTASDKPADFPLVKIGPLISMINRHDWEARLDEDFYFESELAETQPYASEQDRAYDQRLLKKLRDGGNRSFANEIDGVKDMGYAVARGTVWLGELRRSE